MLSYIVRRLLLIVPTLIGITFVVFLVMGLSPGGVGASLLSEEGGMRPEERKAMREYYNKRYGLDKPLLVQYGRWLNQVSPIGFPSYDTDVVRDAQGNLVPVPTDLPPGGKASEPIHRAGDVYFSLWKTYQVDEPETFVNEEGQRRPAMRQDASGKMVPAIKHRKGDRVFWVFKWPNLGDSFTRKRPVVDVVLDALPITLTLNLLAIPIIYAVAITSGIFAARRRGKFQDVGIGALLLGLWSIPTMWTGVMFIGLFASRDVLKLFPSDGLHDTQAAAMTFLPSWQGGFSRGYLLDYAWHLVLPVTCLTYGGFAFLSKLMRSAVLENLAADFVRTARAKGVDEHTVLYRHVLRNSLLPLITVAAGLLPSLLGGSVIVESIFSLNGMGKLMIDAINARDRELILANTLVISALSLLCLLAADLLYAVVDPRVSYE